MFDNREARIRFVRSDKNKDTSPVEVSVLRPETVKLIAERGKEVAKYVGITVVGVYAAVKTIDTLSKIAVKKTKSADNE